MAFQPTTTGWKPVLPQSDAEAWSGPLPFPEGSHDWIRNVGDFQGFFRTRLESSDK